MPHAQHLWEEQLRARHLGKKVQIAGARVCAVRVIERTQYAPRVHGTRRYKTSTCMLACEVGWLPSPSQRDVSIVTHSPNTVLQDVKVPHGARVWRRGTASFPPLHPGRYNPGQSELRQADWLV